MSVSTLLLYVARLVAGGNLMDLLRQHADSVGQYRVALDIIADVVPDWAAREPEVFLARATERDVAELLLLAADRARRVGL